MLCGFCCNHLTLSLSSESRGRQWRESERDPLPIKLFTETGAGQDFATDCSFTTLGLGGHAKKYLVYIFHLSLLCDFGGKFSYEIKIPIECSYVDNYYISVDLSYYY